MNILLLSGSFRKNSASLAIFKTVESLLPKTSTPDLQQLPFYNEDLDNISKPEAVTHFITSVELADGIIICTPEYNHSIPAVLKNAIDWASRPAFKSPLKDKPVSIITQAGSPVGGARAQAHLKLVLDSTLSKIHMRHEMLISEVDNKVDEQLKLNDKRTIRHLQQHINDFIKFIDG